jgi:hypothetical protein
LASFALLYLSHPSEEREVTFPLFSLSREEERGSKERL